MAKVVIMGASSGMGFELATMLATRGVRVGLAARNVKPLEELAARCPGCVEYMPIDVTRPDAVDDLDKLIKKLGGMDLYIHTAGIGAQDTGLDPETEAAIGMTNGVGFMRMVAAAFNYFRTTRRPGRIAAITSVAGTKGIGRLSAYSATKKMQQAYLVALDQIAHNEGLDISITDIRPGWVDTPLLKPGRVYPMEMSVQEASRLILKAIVRRKRVAVIDWRWNVAVGMMRSVPNRVWEKMEIPISHPAPM